MLREPKTIHIEPDSETARLLDEAAGQPVVLETNGRRYRVSREDDPWGDYDPEAVRKAIRAMAGTITPEEGERLKAEIYRAREEGTRPIDRP